MKLSQQLLVFTVNYPRLFLVTCLSDIWKVVGCDTTCTNLCEGLISTPSPRLISTCCWTVHTYTPVSYTHLDVYKRQVSRTVDFGEDRLRGRGSLPATFYVLTRVKYLKIYLNFFKQW